MLNHDITKKFDRIRRDLRMWGTDMMAFIHNYLIDPSTIVKIRHKDVQRGHYYDTDYRMLYVNFQLLVDYVECECGFNGRFLTPWQRKLKWLAKFPVIGWLLPPTRNALTGLHYLRWSMKVKDVPGQAQHAKEVFRLYKWWRKERPARVGPWEAYYVIREGREWMNPLTPTERRLMRKCEKLEAKYDKEDLNNLIALMKIRPGLWT